MKLSDCKSEAALGLNFWAKQTVFAVVKVNDTLVIRELSPGYVVTICNQGVYTARVIVDGNWYPAVDVYNTAAEAEKFVTENNKADGMLMDALVVVDAQVGFTTGNLKSDVAVAKLDNIVNLIKRFKDGLVTATHDTHYKDYLKTFEGQRLPVEHCIMGTEDWELHPKIKEALKDVKHASEIRKNTFGYLDWLHHYHQFHQPVEDRPGDIYICGFCTDICVVSNALLLRASFPHRRIICVENCCAGTSKEAHDAAITVMKSCQIDIE